MICGYFLEITTILRLPIPPLYLVGTAHRSAALSCKAPTCVPVSALYNNEGGCRRRSSRTVDDRSNSKFLKSCHLVQLYPVRHTLRRCVRYPLGRYGVSPPPKPRDNLAQFRCAEHLPCLLHGQRAAADEIGENLSLWVIHIHSLIN